MSTADITDATHSCAYLDCIQRRLEQMSKDAVATSIDVPAPRTLVRWRDELILAALTPQWLEEFSGVYFLVRGERVVYVGMSKNVMFRIYQHRATGRKFERAWFIYCDHKDAFTLEKFFIEVLKPTENISMGCLPGGSDAIGARATNIMER